MREALERVDGGPCEGEDHCTHAAEVVIADGRYVCRKCAEGAALPEPQGEIPGYWNAAPCTDAEALNMIRAEIADTDLNGEAEPGALVASIVHILRRSGRSVDDSEPKGAEASR